MRTLRFPFATRMSFSTLLLSASVVLFVGCASKPEKAPPQNMRGPFNYAPHYMGSATSEKTVFRVYSPPGQGVRPAVVILHGGGWSDGSPSDMETFVNFVVASGWVAVNMGYRLAPEHTWPAQRDDLHASFEELNRRAPELGIDPKRIAVLGYSAGAHLAAIAATTPNPRVPRPVAIVAGAGPYDLTALHDSKFVKKLLGGTKTLLGDKIFRDASPLYQVNAQTPPMWLWHGTWDLTVNIEQSRQMTEALKSAGVEAALRERGARGHITNFLVDDDLWAEIETFLRPKLEPLEP